MLWIETNCWFKRVVALIFFLECAIVNLHPVFQGNPSREGRERERERCNLLLRNVCFLVYSIAGCTVWWCTDKELELFFG
jgi:hypothetical protein